MNDKIPGDKRDNPSADGDEWLLQPGETRRVYEHRRHPDDGRHDPPWRWKKRHPTATEAPLLHHQLHHPFQHVRRQGLQNHRMRILCARKTKLLE